jgi:hypothetical protein
LSILFWFIDDDCITGLSDSDPPNRNSEQTFDLTYVVLGLLGQIFELSHIANRSFPSGQGNVLDFNSLVVLKEKPNTMLSTLS